MRISRSTYALLEQFARTREGGAWTTTDMGAQAPPVCSFGAAFHGHLSPGPPCLVMTSENPVTDTIALVRFLHAAGGPAAALLAALEKHACYTPLHGVAITYWPAIQVETGSCTGCTEWPAITERAGRDLCIVCAMDYDLKDWPDV